MRAPGSDFQYTVPPEFGVNRMRDTIPHPYGYEDERVLGLIRVSALLSIFLFAQVSWSQTSNQGAGVPDHHLETALEFVRTTGANGNLRVIAYGVIQFTQTMAMLATEHGPVVVPVLRKNLNIAAAKRQEEWDQNLARAYAKFFNAEELHSLQSDGRRSPHFDKFSAHRDDVGNEMKASSDLFAGDVAAEALATTVKELGLGER